MAKPSDACRCYGRQLRPGVVAEKQAVNAVAWSPDGRSLASGSDDGVVRFWGAGPGEELRRLEGHRSRVQSVSWSPDGRWLASGSRDSEILIWNTGTRELRRFGLEGTRARGSGPCRGRRTAAGSPSASFGDRRNSDLGRGDPIPRSGVGSRGTPPGIYHARCRGHRMAAGWPRGRLTTQFGFGMQSPAASGNDSMGTRAQSGRCPGHRMAAGWPRIR